MNKTEQKFSTLVVHAGTTPDEKTGAIMTPIYQSSTYVQEAPGVHKGYDYSRADNPTREALEKSYAAIEGAKYALAFSSGLAAVQAVIQTLNPGDHVLVCDDVYGGTGRLFRRLFAKYNIQFDFVDMTDFSITEKNIKAQTKLIWMETPTNPTMKVIDIQRVCDLAKKKQILTLVDNTFASPMFQSPLNLGADIVLHSTTKYIGGHSDIIGGALMFSKTELKESLKFIQFAAGAVPSPFECFLLQRSVKTLAVRMHKHHENVLKVAEFLSKHSKVEKIYFPGHPSHPQYEIAKKQMSGHSGMMSFRMKGTYDDVVKFCKKIKVFALAESLGGVESLVNHPEKMTHASVPEEQRQMLGITEMLIRLSVGIEDAQDLIADLEQALA